jgi:mobilome CxxCx(11)CxxC protein
VSLQIRQVDLETIHQKKMDALAAKHLHQDEIAHLDKWGKLVDYLPLATVIVYLPIRFLAKNTGYSNFIESFWEIAAAILSAASLAKIVYVQGRLENHSKLRDENISLVNQAENLLRQPEAITPASLELFFGIVAKTEKDDRNALRKIPEKQRQTAYREALKEIVPNSVTTTCPRCGASPWEFKSGSCQLCGGTPIPATVT